MPDQPSDVLPTINMLWVEGALGPLERACVRSVLRQGHRLVLWHYFPVIAVPEGVELRDGDEIVARDRLFRHTPTQSWSLFSNLFRYRLLQLGKGIWCDTDTYLLKPIVPIDGYVLGYSQPGMVASAPLGMPADNPIPGELIEFFDGQRIPPWLPLSWRLRYAWQRRRSGRYRIETMLWGNLGPHAVTAKLREHGLTDRVRPCEVYLPWPWWKAHWIFDPSQRIEDWITSETVGIHLYNERIRHAKNAQASPGSFLARLQSEGA